MTATRRPQRIQLRRVKGWRKPAGLIVVSRPTRWGNCYRLRGANRVIGPHGDVHWCAQGEARGVAVRLYREDLVDGRLPYDVQDVRDALAGHDLGCWCPLLDEHGNPSPCHADVLLELANPVG